MNPSEQRRGQDDRNTRYTLVTIHDGEWWHLCGFAGGCMGGGPRCVPDAWNAEVLRWETADAACSFLASLPHHLRDELETMGFSVLRLSPTLERVAVVC